MARSTVTFNSLIVSLITFGLMAFIQLLALIVSPIQTPRYWRKVWAVTRAQKPRGFIAVYRGLMNTIIYSLVEQEMDQQKHDLMGRELARAGTLTSFDGWNRYDSDRTSGRI